MTPLTLPSLIAAAVVPPAAREMPTTALEPSQPASTANATGSPTSFGNQFKQARQRGSVKEASQSPAATSNKPATPHNGEAPAPKSNWTPTTGKAGMAMGKAAQAQSAALKTPAQQQKLHTAAAQGKDTTPASSEAGILATSQTAEAGLGTSAAAVPEALPEALMQTAGLLPSAAEAAKVAAATEVLVATSDIVPTVPGEEAATPPTDPTTDGEVEVSGGCAMPDPADAAVFIGVQKIFVAQPLPAFGGQLTALAQAAMAQLEAALKAGAGKPGADKTPDPLDAAQVPHAGRHGKDTHGEDTRTLRAGARRAEAAADAAAKAAKGVLVDDVDATASTDRLPVEEKAAALPAQKDLTPASPDPNALSAQAAAAAAPQPLVLADKPTQAAAAEAQVSLEVGAASATVPGSVIAGASPAATDAARAPQKAATPTTTATKAEDAEPADAQADLPAASTAAAPAPATPLRASARPEAATAAQPHSAPPKATALPTTAEKETVSATGPAAERANTASPVEFAQVAPAVMAAAAPQDRGQAAAVRPADTAAAVMSATIDPPIQSAAFAPALGARIAVMARDGVEEARLNVHPADMGPITVQLVLDGSLVRVDMSAEMASTRQTLEQALPSLAASLREAGFTLSGGGVSQQANPNNGQPGAQGESGGFRAPQRTISSDSLELNGTTAARGAVGRETGLVDLYA